MAIFDFLFRRKIKSSFYFNERTRKLDLPKIKAKLDSIKSNGEISIDFGKIDSKSKITIPEGVDKNEVIKLDMLQASIPYAINSLSGEAKEAKTIEYIDVLMRLLNYGLTDDKTSESKKKSSYEKTDFGKLSKYLESRGFKSNSLPSNLATNNGYVIWPITLQPTVTYIHTAQIQLIKLLVQAGWKLHIIIGDCGKHSATIKSPINFKKTVEGLLNKNGIAVDEKTVTLLSRYFKRKPDVIDDSLIEEVTSLDLLNTFHTISDSILWYDYFSYITKNYIKAKKEEIVKKRKVLSNLQPLLNWTVVTTITNVSSHHQSKAIVIAGEDEQKQWDEVIKLHGNNRIGLIYIQELKYQNKTMDQSEINIGSENDMLNKLNNGNMAQWLYTHFVEIPKFITKTKPNFCKISDNKCSFFNDNCINCLFGNEKNFKNADFNINEFVSSIYEIANPVI